MVTAKKKTTLTIELGRSPARERKSNGEPPRDHDGMQQFASAKESACKSCGNGEQPNTCFSLLAA